jgi:hypothetical protein
LGGEKDLHAVVQVVVEFFFHRFEGDEAFGAGLRGEFLFAAHPFFKGFFHFNHRVEELPGSTGMFDAVDEGVLQSLVAGHGAEIASRKFVHVAVLAGAVGLVLGVEADLVAVEESVVGAGLGEELHDEWDGIHEHKEGGQDEVGGEGEASALVPSLKQFMEGEGLGEDIAPLFLGGNVGESVLGALEFGEAGVDLQFDRFAKDILLGDEGEGLV